MKSSEPIYLDTYILQKAILTNFNAKCGKRKFGVFFDPANSQIVLKKMEAEDDTNE